MAGWPARHEVTDIAMPYYSVRSLLTLDNDLLFKDNQLVVPSSMRDEMMDCAHRLIKDLHRGTQC